jgi:acetyl esterase/lipase
LRVKKRSNTLLLLGLVLIGGMTLLQGEMLTSLKPFLARISQQVQPLTQRLSPVAVLNTITPKDFRVMHHVAYGKDPRQQLDLYIPLDDSVTPTLKPIILFIHGGSWQTGSKDDYLFVGESFSKAGYVVAVMNYRLAPQHKYPDYVQDAALALRWLADHGADYAADSETLIVMGHSAGGFNALEVVDNQRWLAEVQLPVTHIKAVIGIAGPYSFNFHHFDNARDAFDPNSSPDDIMPDRHVRADAPPHLLLVAANDDTVKASNAVKMAKALRDKHIPVQMQTIEGASHISIMASVATRLSWYKPTRQIILNYLDTVLKNK